MSVCYLTWSGAFLSAVSGAQANKLGAQGHCLEYYMAYTNIKFGQYGRPPTYPKYLTHHTFVLK